MDSQMQQRFLQHIFKFFSVGSDENKCSTDAVNQDAADAHADNQPELKQKGPDLPELLGLLRATGFVVQYHDKSDFGGTSTGCRAVIMCKRSGTRVVMDSEGPCTCPTETSFKQYLDVSRVGPPLSRAPSPTPSTSSMLDAADRGQGPASLEVPPPGPVRQKTWSRDDNAILEEGSGSSAPTSPANRRLSAPPLQSAWTTMHGDELNVLAATDLLQEAMSLLSGVKKVNLRNTPVGPSRRLSATSRRASSDAFVMPMRPLSRTSSASSGLASSRSTSSLVSSQSTHSDTPRPPRAAREGLSGAGALRRSVSVNGSASSATTKTTVTRTKSDATKSDSGSTRIPGSKSHIKPPSAVGAAGNKGTPAVRPTVRPGIKTNASLTTKRLVAPKQIPKSPDIESIKL